MQAATDYGWGAAHESSGDREESTPRMDGAKEDRPIPVFCPPNMPSLNSLKTSRA